MVLENVWMENKDKVVLIEDWMRQLEKGEYHQLGRVGRVIR
jgi:acyl-coenzyme A synthetase/AMP-(fatty) acid ligase